MVKDVVRYPTRCHQSLRAACAPPDTASLAAAAGRLDSSLAVLQSGLYMYAYLCSIVQVLGDSPGTTSSTATSTSGEERRATRFSEHHRVGVGHMHVHKRRPEPPSAVPKQTRAKSLCSLRASLLPPPCPSCVSCVSCSSCSSCFSWSTTCLVDRTHATAPWHSWCLAPYACCLPVFLRSRLPVLLSSHLPVHVFLSSSGCSRSSYRLKGSGVQSCTSMATRGLLSPQSRVDHSGHSDRIHRHSAET